MFLPGYFHRSPSYSNVQRIQEVRHIRRPGESVVYRGDEMLFERQNAAYDPYGSFQKGQICFRLGSFKLEFHFDRRTIEGDQVRFHGVDGDCLVVVCDRDAERLYELSNELATLKSQLRPLQARVEAAENKVAALKAKKEKK